MIGDGSNDCQAIRQANIGISFINVDSSFASPFTSQVNSLSCVYQILL
jgi:cation-transporting ATPase 13A3/4/5